MVLHDVVTKYRTSVATASASLAARAFWLNLQLLQTVIARATTLQNSLRICMSSAPRRSVQASAASIDRPTIFLLLVQPMPDTFNNRLRSQLLHALLPTKRHLFTDATVAVGWKHEYTRR
jgi:hypothetical protein